MIRIPRTDLETSVLHALRRSPAAVLLGPRQCGKTTLAREIAAQRPSEFLDLEDPRDRALTLPDALAVVRAQG